MEDGKLTLCVTQARPTKPVPVSKGNCEIIINILLFAQILLHKINPFFSIGIWRHIIEFTAILEVVLQKIKLVWKGHSAQNDTHDAEGFSGHMFHNLYT